MARCTLDNGYLYRSYITADGIDVYRCGSEDSWNDQGRFFVLAANEVIEVVPSRKGAGWYYTLVDTERRRQKEVSQRITEELEAQQALYRSNLKELEEKQKYDAAAE